MTFIKNTPTQQQILTWLNHVKLFEGLTKDALMPIVENANYIECGNGEIISYEGMPLSGCSLVISGKVEVFRNTYLGEEKIFGIFSSYQLVAIAAVFMPHNRLPMTIRAKTECSVLLLEKNSILQVCENNPIIMQRLLTRFSAKLYEHINNIDWLTSSSAEQRLAAYFLSLCSKQSYQFSLPISRGQLATKLGMRYETLSRLISSWRKQQIIEIESNKIHVLNVTYLNELTLPSQRSF
ncbi:diacylglyceryl transferase [Gilliamella sp. wkB108]|uniref:Crp/Fnr family transcriptional regulator n=1 Tax=Gilliamella sp. wkB108 TaxID=3120256 RepID=UPI00080E27FC|nr:Crp/Fnr family transcriptional regulator [Gilliamella apicola]OCG23653.1 diacylglyceryl transferase [Gilliamella apicola]